MPRPQRTYDHRLVRLVQDTGDIALATGVGVPRSTAAGWLNQAPRAAASATACEASIQRLLLRVATLERRLQRCMALLRVLLALLRVIQPDFRRLRVPVGSDKARLLRAVDRARGVLALPRLLLRVGLSPSRLAAWRRAQRGCSLEDTPSCPHATPHRLTYDEVSRIREMLISRRWRHVPASRLALLAQRTGRVFASASTWQRLLRERGWRRLRLRLHPKAPRQGIRADGPNGLWHIDTTQLRLVDGSRAYIQAILDNYSRRILAWRVSDRREAATSVDLLVQSAAFLSPGAQATVMADQGSENCNRAVDALIEQGLLRRVLAQVDLSYSNSLIEAWWRSLKHNWLFLHSLQSVAQVRKLVGFYVQEHNNRIPQASFGGRTPEEVHAGTGGEIPERIARHRAHARQARLAANRARKCPVCA